MLNQKGFRIPTEDESMTIGFLIGVGLSDNKIVSSLIEMGHSEDWSRKSLDYIHNLTEENQE